MKSPRGSRQMCMPERTSAASQACSPGPLLCGNKFQEKKHMAEVRKHIVFHGRVQGVGFRYTAKYLARSLRLTGWVQNEWDGTVTLEIQGREALIQKLLVGLNHNQFITIEWMDTEEIPLEQESSFKVR